MRYSNYSKGGWWVELAQDKDESGLYFYQVSYEVFGDYRQMKIYDLISAAEVFSSLMNIIRNGVK